MKVFGILGKKQTLLDKGQAVLMIFFFFSGAILENILFLFVCPLIVFSVTFFIREKLFSGKPEWWIFVVRMVQGGEIFYCRQFKDLIQLEKKR